MNPLATMFLNQNEIEGKDHAMVDMSPPAENVKDVLTDFPSLEPLEGVMREEAKALRAWMNSSEMTEVKSCIGCCISSLLGRNEDLESKLLEKNSSSAEPKRLKQKEKVKRMVGPIRERRTMADLSGIRKFLEKNEATGKAVTKGSLYVTQACLVTNIQHSWIVDSGATNHVCCSLLGFKETRRLDPGEFTFSWGNGTVVSAVAVGDYHLSFAHNKFLHLRDVY